MSYSNPYQLGVIDAGSLLKNAATSRMFLTSSDMSVIQPASDGLRMAPREVQDAVTIRVPAHCGTLNDLVEGVRFPSAGRYLERGNLYVYATPMVKKLNASQQAMAEQEFMNFMNPAAVKYPVTTTTPCSMGARKADACRCRDRKNPLTWLLHKPGQVGDSMDVQKCLSTAEKLKARAWISWFHQLWGSQDLPYGYMEVSGKPMFFYTFTLNLDPRTNLMNEDGSVRSGNIQAKPPQYPKLQRARTSKVIGNNISKALQAVGFSRSESTAVGTMVKIDRWDATALQADIDSLRDAMERNDRAQGDDGRVTTKSDGGQDIGSALRWNPRRYKEGQRNNASDLDKAYTRVIDTAAKQAAVYVRDSAAAVWGTLAGLFVTGLTSRVTDAYARQAQKASNASIGTFQKGVLAIQSSQTVVDNMKAMGPQLLENPDPQAAYQVLKQLKTAFNESISQIRSAQAKLPEAPQAVAKLFDRVKKTGGEIEKGLEEAKAKLNQRAPRLDTELKRRFTCKLYAKARNEQQVWPKRLLDQLPPLQGAIQAYASLHPQADQAIARYQQAIAVADDIESQLDLPWWAKDFGPLPVWAWGALGVTTFVGGAVYLRKKRKKVKPNRSMKDLAPVAFQIARTENYNDQAVARALRAELGDDAAKAAKFAHVAAKGGAEANFWRDVQTLLKLGYNRGRRRRRRTSRAA